MHLIEVTRLDAETLNDCLSDVPATDIASETTMLQALRHFWSTRMYVDASWKGMDDNEAWAA